MDMGGIMGGNSSPLVSPTMSSRGSQGMSHGSLAHMTFFWGDRAEILFSGWPGDHGHHIYFLALFLVAAAAAICECLTVFSRRTALQPSDVATFRYVFSLASTAIHALKMGLLYLVMLTVMSFNVGVLIAAIIGHAIGFLIAGRGCPPPAKHGNLQPSVDKV